MTKSIADGNLQRELEQALGDGLRQRFPAPVGDVIATVIFYHPQEDLTPKFLTKVVENDSAAAVAAIVGNAANGSTMHLVRGASIGSALLANREAVERWAREGRTRCEKAGPEWSKTIPEWDWILANPARYIQYARELKRFLNQL